MLSGDVVDAEIVIDGERFRVRASPDERWAYDGLACAGDVDAVIAQDIDARVERFDFVAVRVPKIHEKPPKKIKNM